VTTTGQAKNIAKGQDAARDHNGPSRDADRGNGQKDARNAGRHAPPNARFVAADEDDQHDIEEDLMFDEDEDAMIEE